MLFTSIAVEPLPLGRGPEGLTQLQVRVTLECPVCKTSREYVLANHSNIWRWGLDGTIEENVRNLLSGKFLSSSDGSYPGIRPSQPIPGMFVCSKCGTAGYVPSKDKNLMAEYIRTQVGDLASGKGANWALEELNEFMVKHLEESRSGRFSRSYSYEQATRSYDARNEFLLRLCPCQACEKERKGHYQKIELAEVHFDLSRFSAE